MHTRFSFQTFDSKAFKLSNTYTEIVQLLLNIALKEVITLVAKKVLNPDTIFDFRQYPQLNKQVDALLHTLHDNIALKINEGTATAWDISNAKQDQLIKYLATKSKKHVDIVAKNQYGIRNLEGLAAFQKRKDKGIDLSSRVWNITKNFKRDIGMAIDVSLIEGKSARELAKGVLTLLQNPEGLQQAYKDKNGLSKLLKLQPGQGVYRSAYKNAFRLTRTEINMAYRTSDHDRWNQLDFVMGIEIKLSNNPNHCPLCAKLKGKYPKEFKFVGWHPQCRCYATSILMDDDQFEKYLETDKIDKSNAVNDIPDNFKEWYRDNQDRINTATDIPYFIKDNEKLI